MLAPLRQTRDKVVMLTEIIIVLVLILTNGFLAMSELAIVSSRPARLKILADNGSAGARAALDLAQAPGRFLSAVQIGITLVGVLSGAFSGATLGMRLSEALKVAGMAPGLAETLGVGAVVVAITYLALIVGELVPKQIALRAPEATAARAAPVLAAIARLAAPLVWLLEMSGRIVLRLIGQSGKAEGGASDEEIKLMLSEARAEGVMHERETEMIAGVMRVADRRASGLMTPRHEVETASLDEDPAAIIARFRQTRRSRLPVLDDSPDNVIGVFAAHDFLDLGTDTLADRAKLAPLVTAVPAVNENLSAIAVIEELRRTRGHMLFVFDEYGHFEGIITPMDVLEAITGEFLDEAETEPKVFERRDGSLLVAGWMPVDEFADRLGLTLPHDRDFETVAGLVLEEMGTLPEVGDQLSYGGWCIEIVDLDGRRIDTLLVSREAAA
jgi:putative hemolysin